MFGSWSSVVSGKFPTDDGDAEVIIDKWFTYHIEVTIVLLQECRKFVNTSCPATVSFKLKSRNKAFLLCGVLPRSLVHL